MMNSQLSLPNNKNFIRDCFDLVDLLIADEKERIFLRLQRVKLKSLLLKVLDKIFLGEQVEAVSPVFNFPFLASSQ